LGSEEWDGMERDNKKRKRDTNKMKNTKAEKQDFLLEACGQYLSDWDKKIYTKGEQITKALYDSTGDMPDGIEPWQPFESYPPDEIADLCVMLGEQFEKIFQDGMKQGKRERENTK
jgi:hypothetical protein